MRHGCRFQAIDLRWGVREEAALDQQTMRICLEEIARCQRVTPRPNCIVLLGDRYGWRPLPFEIQSDSTQGRLTRNGQQGEDAASDDRESKPCRTDPNGRREACAVPAARRTADVASRAHDLHRRSGVRCSSVARRSKSIPMIRAGRARCCSGTDQADVPFTLLPRRRKSTLLSSQPMCRTQRYGART